MRTLPRRPALPDTPLRPDELETFKTDVATEAEAPDRASADARPWILVGFVLLGIFLAALIIGVAVALG